MRWPRCATTSTCASCLFFALVAAGATPRATYDAVLLDIDHSPQHVLHPSHTAFYTAEGLRRMAARIAPGGVFALSSDDPPVSVFQAALAEVFVSSSPRPM